MTRNNSEPAITVGSITAAVAAVLALLAAFGLPLTEDQQIAILGVAAIVAPIIVGVVARSFVTPKNQVVAKTEGPKIVAAEAADQAPGTRVRVETAGPVVE